MKISFHTMTLAAALAAVPLSPACSAKTGDGAEEPPTESPDGGAPQDKTPGGGSTTGSEGSTVELAPGAVVVDEAKAASGLKSISDDGVDLTFDDKTLPSTLSAGSILFVRGVALAKVSKVTPSAGQVVVSTEPVALTEAFKNAHVRFATPVSFGAAQASPGASAQGEGLGSVTAAVTGAVSKSGNLKGYDYQVSLTPGAEQLDIDVTVTKKLASIILQVSGKGFVKGFSAEGGFDITDRSLSSFEMAAKKLSGEVNFHWVAGKPNPDTFAEDVVLDLPASYKVPVVIEGVPLVIGLKARLKVTPALTSKNATSEGDFHVTFGGDAGVTVGGGKLGSSGELSGSPLIVDTTNTFSLGVSGFTAAMAFPRIELGLGTLSTSALGYFSLVTSGLTLTPGELGFLHCQKHELLVIGTVGVEETLLGVKLGEQSKQILKKDINATVPPGANCEP